MQTKSLEDWEDYIIQDVKEYDDTDEVVKYECILENAVNNMPTQRQMVYRLVREEGLRISEVADIMNLSARTIEKHLEIAIAYLCDDLKKYIEDQRHHPKIRKLFPRSFLLFF